MKKKSKNISALFPHPLTAPHTAHARSNNQSSSSKSLLPFISARTFYFSFSTFSSLLVLLCCLPYQAARRLLFAVCESGNLKNKLWRGERRIWKRQCAAFLLFVIFAGVAACGINHTPIPAAGAWEDFLRLRKVCAWRAGFPATYDDTGWARTARNSIGSSVLRGSLPVLCNVCGIIGDI